MKNPRVRAHLFRVVPANPQCAPLNALLTSIAEAPLQARIRTVKGVKYRLDELLKQKTKSGTRLWYLDFVRIRDTHGPGRVTDRNRVSSLGLAGDEYFGEETAALFLPDTNHIIIQYNHFGVRPQAIEHYLSSCSERETNAYELNVVLDAAAEEKYRRQNEIRKVTVGIDLSKLTAEQREAGNSLARMASEAASLNGARLQVSISVGHERRRSLFGVKALLDQFLPGNDAVVTAEVSGRASTDNEVETVDLICHKLIFEDEIVADEGRRLAAAARFKFLRRAYGKWQTRIND